MSAGATGGVAIKTAGAVQFWCQIMSLRFRLQRPPLNANAEALCHFGTHKLSANRTRRAISAAFFFLVLLRTHAGRQYSVGHCPDVRVEQN